MALPISQNNTAVPELPAPKGIFDIVKPIDLSADDRALMGISYDEGASFPVKEIAFDAESCLATEPKEFDGTGNVFGTPFSVYSGVKCFLGPAGDTAEEFQRIASQRLMLGEQRAVEKYLQTVIFNETTENTTPIVNDDPQPIHIALALLEEYAGDNYGARPIIHMGRAAATLAAAKGLIEGDETVAKTADVVNGAGYSGLFGPGLFPGQLVDQFTRWIYVTGRIVLRRGTAVDTLANRLEKNETWALSERTYVPTIDGFVAAIKVSLE